MGSLALSLTLLAGSACDINYEASIAQDQVEDYLEDRPDWVDYSPCATDSESPLETVSETPEDSLTLSFSPGIRPLADGLGLTDLGWHMLYCGQPEIISPQATEDLCPDHPQPDHCYDYRFGLVSGSAYEWGKINVPEFESSPDQEKALRHGLLHLIYDHYYQLGEVDELHQSIRQAAELNPEIEARIVANHSAASQDPQDSYGHYLLMSELHAELLAGDNLPQEIRQHYDRYFQSLEIDDLPEQIGLTSLGREIFDETDIRIFASPEHRDYNCSDDENIPSSLFSPGCYSRHGPTQIKLIDGSSIRHVLAHEFVHAIYYERLDRGEIEHVHRLVDEGFALYPELKRFLVEDLALKGDYVHSEGYAYLLHYAKELSPELEANYALFFEDRQIIVDSYQPVLRNLAKQTPLVN